MARAAWSCEGCRGAALPGDVVRFDGGVVLDLDGSAMAAVGGTTEGRQ